MPWRGFQEQIDEQRLDRCRVVADLVVARRLGRLSSSRFSVSCRPPARNRPGGPPACRPGPPSSDRAAAGRGRSGPRSPAHAEHSLANQRARPRARPAPRMRASVKQAANRSINPIARSVCSQQQRTGIRCDRATIKRRHHRAARDRCKFKQRRVTLCRHRGTPPLQQKPSRKRTFADSEPRCTYPV